MLVPPADLCPPAADRYPPADVQPGAATLSPPALPADADAWVSLAHTVAGSASAADVAAIVATIATELGVEVDLDADLVVLQRTFGRLHRLVSRG